MKICIVEDDINYRKSLEIAFKDYPQYKISSFKNAKDALAKIAPDTQIIITDINMPQMDGLQFLQELPSVLKGVYDAIVITGNASVQNAIKAIRLGVKDFLIKGFSFEELIATIERIQKEQSVLGSLRSSRDSEISESSQQSNSFSESKSPESQKNITSKDFIANSAALQAAQKIALKAAPTDANVFLMGESGVGKDVFANFIHRNSSRAKAPFIAINMAAIPEHLLESELFGYEKGAFTDATTSKPGILEDANGGSVFLDEIGEMPIALQAKLLRVLQEKTLTRLGSSKEIPINVRFISATNANIAQKISQGAFREDLFFRLQTIPILIPPLRERKEEILDIAKFKLSACCTQYGFAPKKFSPDSEKVMLEYSWHGNVRELLSVVERACILSDGDLIEPEDLALDSRHRVFGGAANFEFSAQSYEKLQQEFLSQTLSKCGGDLDKASQMLGMHSNVLRSKIAELGL